MCCRRSDPQSPAPASRRLRDYLGWLVAEGQPVYGVVLPRVFDIDRARDIVAAELAGLGSERGNTRRMSAAKTAGASTASRRTRPDVSTTTPRS